MRPFPLLSASVFALAAALTLPNGAPSQAQPARRAAAAPQVPSQLPRNVRPLYAERTPAAKPARPEGGECQAARALYALLSARYG